VDQNQPLLIRNFDRIRIFLTNFEKNTILVHLVNAFSQKFSQNRQSGLIRFYLVNALKDSVACNVRLS
jgi:hypothetical protein